MASKSKVRRLLSRGNAGGLDPAFGAAPCPVVALGHQQFGEEAAVGHLVAGGGLGEISELGTDGGQPQQPAGGVDGSVSGLLGEMLPPLSVALKLTDIEYTRSGPPAGGARTR